jgi:hypothetical protein
VADPNEQPADPWDVYRRRRWLWWFAFLAAVPFVVGGGVALTTWAGAERPVPYLIIGWSAFFMFAARRLHGCQCPRCRKPFFDTYPKTLWNQNPRPARCIHCGLPKWERPGTPDPTT